MLLVVGTLAYKQSSEELIGGKILRLGLLAIFSRFKAVQPYISGLYTNSREFGEVSRFHIFDAFA